MILQALTYKPQKSTTWHFQWIKKGQKPSLTINPGEISGFEKYFQNAPPTLSTFYLGVTGTQRFEVADWLNQQAQKLGLDQYVTEFQVSLNHPFQNRINGIDAQGNPINEYELTKATTALKHQLAGAWSQVVMSSDALDNQTKIELLTAAASGDVNEFLPLSSVVFSKAVENMHPEFQSARAIIFPAIPLAFKDWRGKPVKMIAFKKETIVSIKPMWRVEDELAA
jgi:hypothetical protein